MNAPLIGARLQRKEEAKAATSVLGVYTGADLAAAKVLTDALSVKDLPMPATAQTVWRSLQRQAA